MRTLAHTLGKPTFWFNTTFTFHRTHFIEYTKKVRKLPQKSTSRARLCLLIPSSYIWCKRVLRVY